MSNVAISYTGGKNSTLALQRTLEEGHKVSVLVTFCPPFDETTTFKAHSLEIIAQQSKALGIPHSIQIVDGPDYAGSYRQAMIKLREEYGIDGLVTGDIVPVCSGFMERALEGSGVGLVKPLWGETLQDCLNDMWDSNYKILMTCINLKKIPEEVLKTVKDNYEIGHYLNQKGLDSVGLELPDISATGEFGELHTMVVDCPLYKTHKLSVEGERLVEDSFAYLKIKSVQLYSK